MKKKWKSILLGFAIYFISYIAFNKFFFGEFDRESVGKGIFFGLGFALMFPMFMGKKAKMPPEIDLKPDEGVARKETAKRLRAAEAVEGLLILTNKRLIFKPHKFSLDNQKQEFPLREIKAFFPIIFWPMV